MSSREAFLETEPTDSRELKKIKQGQFATFEYVFET